jgi:hypothetical protein
VSKLLDRWLEQCEADLSPKTVLEIRGHIRRSITPTIGNRRVTRLSTVDLDDLYRHLRANGGKEGGLSAATIREVHSILRCLLVLIPILAHSPARR